MENKKFFNKYIPKELAEKFGITSVHFYPFENMEYVYDTEDMDEIIRNLKDFTRSTIYEGYRYFFKDFESLKKFCEMAENGELK